MSFDRFIGINFNVSIKTLWAWHVYKTKYDYNILPKNKFKMEIR